MERKITQEMMRWKSDPDHLPLIITGCRQIGKTYSIREFVSSEYRSSVYINFETEPDKKAIFEGPKDADTILSKIILSENVRLFEGRSAIILDEIQACPDAYSALKALACDRRYDIVCSGSFLGMNLEDNDGLSPLGYVKILRMHPMDFEEFLWAMNINKDLVSEIAECIRTGKHIDDYFNKAITEHFLTHIVVGGMPQAVKTYAETHDYVKTRGILSSIMTILKKDAGRYSRKAGRLKINKCLESVPHQLSRENKKFIYADVEKNSKSGYKTYGNAIEWLSESGIVTICNALEEPILPLSAKAKNDSFKVFMNDTGLLMALMDDSEPADIVLRNPYANNGAVMENAIASALIKNGYRIYYYSKRNSTLKIDFVIDMGGSVTLLEVKSGMNTKAKSLRTMMAEKDRQRTGYKIMNGNIETEETGIIHMPLYAPCFFCRPETDIPAPESSDEINRRYEEMKKKAS